MIQCKQYHGGDEQKKAQKISSSPLISKFVQHDPYTDVHLSKCYEQCLLCVLCHAMPERKGQKDCAAWTLTLSSPLPPPLSSSIIFSSILQHLIISGFHVAIWMCPAEKEKETDMQIYIYDIKVCICFNKQYLLVYVHVYVCESSSICINNIYFLLLS